MRTPYSLLSFDSVEIRHAIELCKTLQHKGHEAYFAGGAVRDLLLKRPIHDIDIATSAPPEESLALFPSSHYHGRSFGVVEVNVDGFSYQVATFRTESDYRDHRHPDVVEFSTAKADAQRRDFTINALFLDPVQEEMLDYTGGGEDIRTGTLRTVGTAKDRFQEDALRLLRAIRFLYTLPVTPADDLIPALKDNAPLIKHISRERIFHELNRLFTESESLDRAVNTLLDTELLTHIDPSFFSEEAFHRHLRKRFDPLTPLPAITAWLLLTLPEEEHKTATSALNVLNRLRCPHTILSAAEFVQHCRNKLPSWHRVTRLEKMEIRDHQAVCYLRTFIQADPGSLHTKEVESFLADLDALPATPSPLISGTDLLQIGYTPSPEFGKTLRELYEAQVDGQFHTREQGLSWFKQKRSGPPTV